MKQPCTVCISGECLYNTDKQLFKRVKKFCHNPSAARDAGIGAIVSVFIYCYILCVQLNIIIIIQHTGELWAIITFGYNYITGK